uniref:Immunoglobulin domain-containing protein n=1 Tax=Myripristis murdjan TaxID=586833 RepID=A0A667Z636_9TELE
CHEYALAISFGIHSITTVNNVSVRAGGSISIPCLYDTRYKNHVKYLCKGSYWLWCSYEVKTNQPSTPGRFSISDDKKQRIFTVTINDLMAEDTDYWCAVEIKPWPDKKQKLNLSVSEGFNGGSSISIPCFYDPRYKNHVKYLCKGAGWYGCTYEVKTNQPSTSGRFSISDDKKQRIFAVTINDLTAADTDYWCIVEINNGLSLYFLWTDEVVQTGKHLCDGVWIHRQDSSDHQRQYWKCCQCDYE